MLEGFCFSSTPADNEQVARASEVVSAIQRDDGELAASTFGIGLHNGFAHKLYGRLADDISDALRKTQTGRACLSLGLQLYMRKRTESALDDAERELRGLRQRLSRPNAAATYMSWPVETVEVPRGQILIRNLSRNTLEIVPESDVVLLPESRRSHNYGTARP